MKNEQYKEMYRLYNKGLSLSEVADKYSMTRQSVYIGFKRRKYKLRTRKTNNYVIYDGHKFTIRNNGYYGKTVGKRCLLHRYKYEKEVGDIPSGWDIHHLDHNKTNNDIENLVAIPKSVHAKLFSTGANQYGKHRRVEDLGARKREIDKY